MLFPYLLKVSLLLAALTLSYRWLIQYETFSRVNRALLWLNVLAAWSLPLIPLADWGPVEVQQEFHRTLPVVVSKVPVLAEKVTPNGVPRAVVTVVKAADADMGVLDWLYILYGLGVLFLAIRFLTQLFRMLRTLWHLPSQRLGQGVLLVRDGSTDSPYSFFRWIVCNPEKHQPQELHHILAHESEHVRQWHSLDLLLAEVQRILLWFNPFSWVHQRMVQTNLEYLADQAVLESGFNRKQYQVDLLKAALQTRELPLTNSFAQSLLKQRIKMMNRKPSRLWVWGKYVCLLAVLYLSSAFVAPYRAQLIALAPAPIQPVVSAMMPEGTSVQEIAPQPAPAEVPEVEPAPTPTAQVLTDIASDSLRQGRHSKWTLVKGDTLYWAISPLATWEEIGLIMKDVKEFGGEMKVNGLQYDPLNLFLTSIHVYIKTPRSAGMGKAEEGIYTPSKGYSGFVRNGGLGMGQLPPEPLLTAMQNDYKAALGLKEEHLPKYAEDSLDKVIHKNEGRGFGTSTYPKKSLEGEYGSKNMANAGIGKSTEGTLLITEKYRNAEFYLNGRPSGYAEVNSVSFDKLHSVSIKSVGQVVKYVLVFTK